MRIKYNKLITWAALSLFLAVAPSAADAKLKSCDKQKTEDYGKEQCTIPITDLRLTQYAVGKRAVACKIKKVDKWIEKYQDRNPDDSMVTALNAYLNKSNRHIPLVRGPTVDGDKTFYTTDHHHLGTAVWNYEGFQKLTKKKKKKVLFIATVKSNKKDLSWTDFWKAMIQEKRTWPYDNHGKRLPDSDFNSEYGPYPHNFGQMYEPEHDDKYRTLSRWVRENCLYVKAGKEQCDLIAERAGLDPQAADFMEFVWANYLREKHPWPTQPAQSHDSIYLSIYSEAPESMRSTEASRWLSKQGFDPKDYGYHANGQYLYLNFTEDTCEDPLDLIITP